MRNLTPPPRPHPRANPSPSPVVPRQLSRAGRSLRPGRRRTAHPAHAGTRVPTAGRLPGEQVATPGSFKRRRAELPSDTSGNRGLLTAVLLFEYKRRRFGQSCKSGEIACLVLLGRGKIEERNKYLALRKELRVEVAPSASSANVFLTTHRAR